MLLVHHGQSRGVARSLGHSGSHVLIRADVDMPLREFAAEEQRRDDVQGC